MVLNEIENFQIFITFSQNFDPRCATYSCVKKKTSPTGYREANPLACASALIILTQTKSDFDMLVVNFSRYLEKTYLNLRKSLFPIFWPTSSNCFRITFRSMEQGSSMLPLGLPGGHQVDGLPPAAIVKFWCFFVLCFLFIL